MTVDVIAPAPRAVFAKCEGCAKTCWIGAAAKRCARCADAWLVVLANEVGQRPNDPEGAVLAIRRREGAGGRERLLVTAMRRFLETETDAAAEEDYPARRKALDDLLAGRFPPPHELSALAKLGLPYTAGCCPPSVVATTPAPTREPSR